MSVPNENVDEKLAVEAKQERAPSVLDRVIKERDSRKPAVESSEDEGELSKKEVKTSKNVKESKITDKIADNVQKPEEKDPSEENKVSEKKVSENKSTETKVDDDEDRDLEVGNLRKALADSQKWGHTNNKRLKSVVKIVSSLKEQGVLTEDEFTNINELLNSDSPEEEPETVSASISPMAHLIKIANKRLGDLREFYEGDPLFDKKIAAFDLCINNSSDQEIDEIYDDLEQYEKNDLKLVKRMYQIGEKHYNEGYKEIDELGGLTKFASAKNSEIKRLQKKIDKLESNLLEYNDHDKPTYKIDELGDTLTTEMSLNKPGDVLGSVMKRRDNRKNR